jgi:uncharacterized protein (TIGR00162 family)
MRKTVVKERSNVVLKNPILVEGLPGLGTVGKIAVQYLRRQMKAKRLAELYSPHFAYYVLVTKRGSVRLLRNEFYYWQNEQRENDLILLTGDTQAQTIEGQYEVARSILDYADSKGVKLVITVGGYKTEVKDIPRVVAASTNHEVLKKALESGAISSPLGNPIVGISGLLLGLARMRNTDALCLLGETPGYMPDPTAAKRILNVITTLLKIDIDLEGLEKEIDKSEHIMERMREIEKQRELAVQRMRKAEEERVTYIS